MHRTLIRIVALALVPCLLADPLTAAGLAATPTTTTIRRSGEPGKHHFYSSPVYPFDDQALQAELVQAYTPTESAAHQDACRLRREEGIASPHVPLAAGAASHPSKSVKTIILKAAGGWFYLKAVEMAFYGLSGHALVHGGFYFHIVWFILIAIETVAAQIYEDGQHRIGWILEGHIGTSTGFRSPVPAPIQAYARAHEQRVHQSAPGRWMDRYSSTMADMFLAPILDFVALYDAWRTCRLPHEPPHRLIHELEEVLRMADLTVAAEQKVKTQRQQILASPLVRVPSRKSTDLLNETVASIYGDIFLELSQERQMWRDVWLMEGPSPFLKQLLKSPKEQDSYTADQWVQHFETRLNSTTADGYDDIRDKLVSAFRLIVERSPEAAPWINAVIQGGLVFENIDGEADPMAMKAHPDAGTVTINTGEVSCRHWSIEQTAGYFMQHPVSGLLLDAGMGDFTGAKSAVPSFMSYLTFLKCQAIIAQLAEEENSSAVRPALSLLLPRQDQRAARWIMKSLAEALAERGVDLRTFTEDHLPDDLARPVSPASAAVNKDLMSPDPGNSSAFSSLSDDEFIQMFLTETPTDVTFDREVKSRSSRREFVDMLAKNTARRLRENLHKEQPHLEPGIPLREQPEIYAAISILVTDFPAIRTALVQNKVPEILIDTLAKTEPCQEMYLRSICVVTALSAFDDMEDSKAAVRDAIRDYSSDAGQRFRLVNSLRFIFTRLAEEIEFCAARGIPTVLLDTYSDLRDHVSDWWEIAWSSLPETQTPKSDVWRTTGKTQLGNIPSKEALRQTARHPAKRSQSAPADAIKNAVPLMEVLQRTPPDSINSAWADSVKEKTSSVPIFMLSGALLLVGGIGVLISAHFTHISHFTGAGYFAALAGAVQLIVGGITMLRKHPLERQTGDREETLSSNGVPVSIGITEKATNSAHTTYSHSRTFKYPAGNCEITVSNPNHNYVKTSAGAVSVGMSMLTRSLFPDAADYPSIVVAPHGSWTGADGSNLMQTYFAIAASSAFYQRRMIIVATPEQQERIRRYLKLGNPYEFVNKGGYDRATRTQMRREVVAAADRMLVNDSLQMVASPSGYMVQFVSLENNVARVGDVTITDNEDGTFTFVDENPPDGTTRTTTLDGNFMREMNVRFEGLKPMGNIPEFGITFLGTSSGMDPDGMPSSHVVWAKGHGILVDAGAPTRAAIEALGIRPTDITELVLTHLHEDHVADALAFFKWRHDQTRAQRLDLVMEPGIYDLFCEQAELLLGRPLREAYPEIHPVSLPFGSSMELSGGVLIEAERAWHGTWTPMLRISCDVDSRRRMISLSGDTIWDPYRFERILANDIPDHIRRDLNWVLGDREGGKPILDEARINVLQNWLYNRDKDPDAPLPDMVVLEGGNAAATGENTSNHTTPLSMAEYLAPEQQSVTWVNHTKGLPEGIKGAMRHAPAMTTIDLRQTQSEFTKAAGTTNSRPPRSPRSAKIPASLLLILTAPFLVGGGYFAMATATSPIFAQWGLVAILAGVASLIVGGIVAYRSRPIPRVAYEQIIAQIAENPGKTVYAAQNLVSQLRSSFDQHKIDLLARGILIAADASKDMAAELVLRGAPDALVQALTRIVISGLESVQTVNYVLFALAAIEDQGLGHDETQAAYEKYAVELRRDVLPHLCVELAKHSPSQEPPAIITIAIDAIEKATNSARETGPASVEGTSSPTPPANSELRAAA